MKRLKRILKKEKGSVAVIAAVAFMAVSAFTGMAIDLGAVYMEGSDMQSAADAAAYSVASMLPIGAGDTATQNQAEARIIDYVQKNGYTSDTIQSIEFQDSINGKYTSVRVSMQTDVYYSFGPIVGVDGARVDKSAKVGLEAASGVTGAVPLGMPTEDFLNAMNDNGAQSVVVKYGGGGGENGAFGALDLDGSQGGGANEFRDRLAYGYPGVNYIGQVIPTENGNMAGPTNQAFTTRYNACTHYPGNGGCTPGHFVDGCPRLTYMVIYDELSKHSIQITGFAPFILVGINGNGEVIASHADISLNEGDSVPLTSTNIEFGLYRVRLME